MQVAEREIVNDQPMVRSRHIYTAEELATNYVTLDEFHEHLQSVVDDFYHYKRNS